MAVFSPVISVLGLIRQNIITTLLFGVVFFAVRRRYFHPLSKFPGPFFASVTSLWRIYYLHSEKQHESDAAFHRKYGPVFRDGPNSLSFSDPNAVEPIYGRRTHGEFSKSGWYNIFNEHLDGRDYTTFSSLPVQQHRRLKKRVAGIYSMTSIIEYESRFDDNILNWLERLEKLGGEPIEFGTWTHYLTLDLISDIVHGEPLGFTNKGGDINGYQKSLHEGFKFLTTVGYLGLLTSLLKSPLIGPLIAPSRKDKSGFGHLMGIAEDLVEDRIKNGDTVGRPHLALGFVNAKNEDGTRIAANQAVGELMATINAGSESTAVVISAIINYVLRDRRVYGKLILELSEASQRGELSQPIVSYTETMKLPYFTAVVKEGMRLFPIFSGNLSRVVVKGGYEVLPGVFVPEGAEVGVNPYICHRDKGVFGEDAEEFRPERWLPLDSERTRMMEKHIMAWGYGSRTCLGRNIAQIEVNKAVIEVLRRFDVTFLRPDLPFRFKNFIQLIIEDMYVQIMPRKNRF